MVRTLERKHPASHNDNHNKLQVFAHWLTSLRLTLDRVNSLLAPFQLAEFMDFTGKHCSAHVLAFAARLRAPANFSVRCCKLRMALLPVNPFLRNCASPVPGKISFYEELAVATSRTRSVALPGRFSSTLLKY